MIKKAIFIASLSNPSASGRQRLWAMQACGVDVVVVNKDDWAINRLVALICNKFKINSLLLNKQLGTHILDFINVHKPDIVWIEWCKEIPAYVLEAIMQMACKPLLVSFVDDNPWGKRVGDLWMWGSYFKSIPFFDVHIVKRDSDIANIQRLGGGKCYKWPHGIYTPLFKPASKPTTILYPVSFVGTCMDGRDKLIGFLLEKGIDVHVFGNKWQQRSLLPKKYPINFHAAVEGDAYVSVIQQSAICLGLVSHSNEDEWTMRTYEVVGCKKLLLAEQTVTHRMLFEKYQNEVLFVDAQDCYDKIVALQQNKNLADKISTDLHNCFLEKQYTLDHTMYFFLNAIK